MSHTPEQERLIKTFFINHKRSTVEGLVQYMGIRKKTVEEICEKLLKENFIKKGKLTVFDWFFPSEKDCFRLVRTKMYSQPDLF